MSHVATKVPLVIALDQFLRINEQMGPDQGTVAGSDEAYQGVNVPHAFFVDGDNGQANNSGLDPRAPLLTIQSAVDLCVSGRHDVVYVRTASSAYAENVTVTSKDYVSIIGWGHGDWGRPDVNPASGIALAISLSQGFHAENVFFVSDDDDAVTVDSDGWLFRNCKFMGNSDGLFLKGNADNDSYTASQGLAVDCVFWACGAAGVKMEHAEADSGVGTTDNHFVNCVFKENTGVDFLSAVGSTGGGAGIFINLVIEKCKFLDVAAGHVYFDMDQGVGADLSANTCLICNNWFADEAFVAAQCDISGQPGAMFVGNYDAAGLIDGSTFNN